MNAATRMDHLATEAPDHGSGHRSSANADPLWKSMDTAPQNRQILVRRHNDVFFEYYVVWYSSEDEHYEWRNDWTAFPEGRLDGWCEIPGEGLLP